MQKNLGYYAAIVISSIGIYIKKEVIKISTMEIIDGAQIFLGKN